ncbi:hypothetical protein D3C75_581950 [compost metagenome]
MIPLRGGFRMTRIIFMETAGFLAKGLHPGEVQQLSQFALERFDQDSSNYFTVAKKGATNNIVFTDGNGIVLESCIVQLSENLDEDFWIIIDDYRACSQNAIQINFLLPKEY